MDAQCLKAMEKHFFLLEQPVLAATAAAAVAVSNSSSISKQQQRQQAAAGGKKVLATTPWLKTGIQVAQNDRRAKEHHHKQILCHFKPCSSFYGRFSVPKMAVFGLFSAVFWTIVPKVQDDRRYAKPVFPIRAVVLSWRLGHHEMANGCAIRRVPRRGATWWSILRLK